MKNADSAACFQAESLLATSTPNNTKEISERDYREPPSTFGQIAIPSDTKCAAGRRAERFWNACYYFALSRL